MLSTVTYINSLEKYINQDTYNDHNKFMMRSVDQRPNCISIQSEKCTKIENDNCHFIIQADQLPIPNHRIIVRLGSPLCEGSFPTFHIVLYKAPGRWQKTRKCLLKSQDSNAKSQPRLLYVSKSSPTQKRPWTLKAQTSAMAGKQELLGYHRRQWFLDRAGMRSATSCFLDLQHGGASYVMADDFYRSWRGPNLQSPDWPAA